MASASTPADELAVHLAAPASSLAVPPPAPSAAEAVGLSAGAAVLEDPGAVDAAATAAAAASTRAGFLPDCLCLLIFIYSRQRSRRFHYINVLEVVALVSFSPCVSHMHQVLIFSSLPVVYYSSCFFAFWSYFRRFFVCTYSCAGSDTATYYCFVVCTLYMNV